MRLLLPSPNSPPSAFSAFCGAKLPLNVQDPEYCDSHPGHPVFCSCRATSDRDRVRIRSQDLDQVRASPHPRRWALAPAPFRLVDSGFRPPWPLLRSMASHSSYHRRSTGRQNSPLASRSSNGGGAAGRSLICSYRRNRQQQAIRTPRLPFAPPFLRSLSSTTFSSRSQKYILC
jgi:hypothetical protein